MGRQINFYMSEAVEREFFEIICSNGYKILYRNFIDERIEKNGFLCYIKIHMVL